MIGERLGGYSNKKLPDVMFEGCQLSLSQLCLLFVDVVGAFTFFDFLFQIFFSFALISSEECNNVILWNKRGISSRCSQIKQKEKV